MILIHRPRFGLVAIVLCSLVFARPASAQQTHPPGSFGIGVGTATIAGGLSLKLPISRGVAFQGVVGIWRDYGHDWRYGHDSMALGVDLLYDMPLLLRSYVCSLGWNFGLGVGAGVETATNALVGGAGTTAVLGLALNFVPIPIDLVLEYRPGLYVIAGASAANPLDFSAHMRFWF